MQTTPFNAAALLLAAAFGEDLEAVHDVLFTID